MLRSSKYPRDRNSTYIYVYMYELVYIEKEREKIIDDEYLEIILLSLLRVTFTG